MAKTAPAAVRYWLVKSEPETYSFTEFLLEKTTAWTGVRNFQSRNTMREMKKGDMVFYYHSGGAREIVGLAEVSKTFYPDPTAEEGDWSCVDLKAKSVLKRPITLAEIKAEPAFKEMVLVRNSRLSVQPVTEAEAKRLLAWK